MGVRGRELQRVEQTFREAMEQIMGQPEMRGWFHRTMEVVESGSREFY